MAQHVAHLFIRDPISLFAEKLHQSEEDMDHFEVPTLQPLVSGSYRTSPSFPSTNQPSEMGRGGGWGKWLVWGGGG